MNIYELWFTIYQWMEKQFIFSHKISVFENENKKYEGKKQPNKWIIRFEYKE